MNFILNKSLGISTLIAALVLFLVINTGSSSSLSLLGGGVVSERTHEQSPPQMSSIPEGSAISGSPRPLAGPSALLFEAIREVESAGDNFAIGRNGELGPYQIGPAYWADAIEYGEAQWDYHELVWSRAHCEQVMRWYWKRYGAKTDEERARMHNGGWIMKGTDMYWEAIKELMKEQDDEDYPTASAEYQKSQSY